ncbi:SIT4-associating protein Sap155p [[Candida] railenensis]|uniref:SIT4-associating protein Sap155p n=1 Tax=[Candida] railenensis TaxID=45579 RepID=A0A9P0QVJ8_9ASCO|nr:SIT4-associating protein Sap155p [[Candida] railenensis]
MSFWPFTNSLNNNSRLQKFLDSVSDPAAVSVEDLVGDSELSSEIVSELHSIKGNYGRDAGNFPFQQQQQQQAQSQQQQQQQQSGQSELLAQHLANEDDHALTPVGPSSFNNNNADSGSVSSYSEAGGGGNLSKDARGAKLLEILIQPHILNGFLDYIVESVGFFDEDSKAAELEIIREAEQKPLSRDTAELPDPDKNDAASDIIQEEDENELEELENQDADEEEEKGEEKEESSQDKMRRYIQTSSDILSIDLWIISNRIIETPVIISKLWSILSLPQLSEVSPSVTYLIHILDQLMDANSIELLNFIRRQPDLVETFLGKIEIPMLMDFFLRVIQTDKIDYPTGILETLSSQKLIPQLVDILKPRESQFDSETSEGTSSGIPDAQLFFKQTAATDFIKALVTISSNTALAINLETNIGPNQLTRELVSREIVETIVKDIILFKPPKGSNIKTNKHGINNCVGIIIELIRKNNSDYDTNCGTYSLEDNQQNNGGGGGQSAGAEVNSYVMFQWLKDFEQNPPGARDPIYLGEMLEIFSDHLDQLADLMMISHEKEKELGFTNFKLSELIAELLHCSNMILLNSKKIKKVIKAREYVRSQQSKLLKRALNESMLSEDGLDDVTHGLDDVSLDNISLLSNRKKLDEITMSNDDYDDGEESLMMLELDAEDTHSDSDDEPVISPENPFVGPERDNAIRLNPCIGDKFKIDLVDSGLLEQIVRKFTEYPWHNFFHNVVFDLVQQIFNGKLNSYNSFLIVELFKPEKCNLTGLIYIAYREKLEPRPGYLGHLILISEEIVKFTSLYKPDLISPIIVDAVTSDDWEWFVTEVLLKTREVYNAVLGAAHGFEDDDEDDINKKDDDDDVFGFDSGTVGYLDLENYGNGSKVIVLGDKDNHEEFVNDGSNGGADDDDEIENSRHNMEDEDEDDIEEDMPDVKLTSSLVGTVDGVSEVGGSEGAIELDGDGIESEFLENLSGSSSSEDDDEDEVDGSATNDDDNELRRVPKHNS